MKCNTAKLEGLTVCEPKKKLSLWLTAVPVVLGVSIVSLCFFVCKKSRQEGYDEIAEPAPV